MTFVKASLTNLDTKTLLLTFQFNPTQIVMSRKVQWGRTPPTTNLNSGSGAAPQSPTSISSETGVNIESYQYTEPFSLTLKDILFDNFESRQSVVESIEKLRETVTPSVVITSQGKGGSPRKAGVSQQSRKRPPYYLFEYGPFKINCVVDSLSFTYSVWMPDGTPLRALVTLTLKETTIHANKGPGVQDSVRVGNSVSNRITAGISLGVGIS